MNKWSRAGSIAAGLVVLDQLSKAAVTAWLAPFRQIKVIPGLFDLVYVLNPGVAFGMFAGVSPLPRIALLSALAVAAVVVMALFIRSAHESERLFITALALICGGAVGNVIDRIRLGAVIDFLEVYLGRYHWPVFNVADIGITVGAAFILIYLWQNRHAK